MYSNSRQRQTLTSYSKSIGFNLSMIRFVRSNIFTELREHTRTNRMYTARQSNPKNEFTYAAKQWSNWKLIMNDRHEWVDFFYLVSLFEFVWINEPDKLRLRWIGSVDSLKYCINTLETNRRFKNLARFYLLSFEQVFMSISINYSWYMSS